jgi:hypothetical protein
VNKAQHKALHNVLRVFAGAVRGFSSPGVWQATVSMAFKGKRMQKFARLS